MPISTGRTRAPEAAAILQTDDPRRPMENATAFVTSCPDWLIPSATTPLSPIMTIIALSSKRGVAVRIIAPHLLMMCSNSPSESSGFAMLSRYFFAAA